MKVLAGIMLGGIAVTGLVVVGGVALLWVMRGCK